MTLMSCRRAEKLMPLHAAGDLPAGRAGRAVAAHVASCASCAALAEEFRASREWATAAGDVPEFGEEFYEGLRAGVLDRVNRDPRPAAPSRVASLFPALFAGRRLAYAASLALAACALALALYFTRGPETFRGPDQTAAATPSESPAPAATRAPGSFANLGHVYHERTHAEPTPQGSTTRESGGQEQREPSADAAPRDNRRGARQAGKTAGGGGGNKRPPTLDRKVPPRDAAPPRELTASNDAARPVTATVAPRAETAGVSRIEIQTADPNIRIIWLAPSSGDEAEPGGVDPDR